MSLRGASKSKGNSMAVIDSVAKSACYVFVLYIKYHTYGRNPPQTMGRIWSLFPCQLSNI